MLKSAKRNLLIEAVHDKFDEWEVLVPMWMNAATRQAVIGKLEKETELSTRKSSAGHTCCETVALKSSSNIDLAAPNRIQCAKFLLEFCTVRRITANGNLQRDAYLFPKEDDAALAQSAKTCKRSCERRHKL